MAHPNSLIETQKELLSHSYSQAMAYTNLIMVGGYASFFGLWSLTKENLTVPQVFWAGILVIISILTFVVFEIYKMYLNSQTFLELSKAVNDPPRFEAHLTNYKKNAEKSVRKLGKVWIIVLLICIPTGLGGVGVLLYSFIKGLLNYYS